MALLVWVWLASPFVVIAVITHDPDLRRLVAIHYSRCQAAGVAGVAMMCLGAALTPSWPGTLLILLGAPLSGLVVWRRGDDGEDGGEEPPDVPPIDWDALERSLRAPARLRGG